MSSEVNHMNISHCLLCFHVNIYRELNYYRGSEGLYWSSYDSLDDKLTITSTTMIIMYSSYVIVD